MTRRDAARELREVDAVFAALAHASRRHVLLVLHARGGEMSAGEIASRFACSWPTTTRHLKRLVEAGLVRVEKEGRERLYRLDADTLRRVAGGWLGSFDRRHPAPDRKPPKAARSEP
ncbi:MAG: ArsR/SmtB family transcription factor [Myxococcota bacterium]